MKKKFLYHQSKEYAQHLFFGFKPVLSADDVMDNLEKFIRINFSLNQRAHILLAVDNVAQNNLLLEWKRKEKKWIKDSPYAELTKSVLALFLEYHMTSNSDEAADWLEMGWHGRVEPLANKAVEPFILKSNMQIVENPTGS
jgi:hypothetical protein